jgi:16S rRNA processing protein RimM
MADSEELIPVGKIIGTHGIKGYMKLNSYSGNSESLSKARTVILKAPDGTFRDLALNDFKINSGRFIISLRGYDEINQVSTFIGNELCIKRSDLPQLPDDEFYWSDLIGLNVITDEGTLLGCIKDIFETGSNDIYVVQGTDREYLIPAIGDVVKQVDIKGGTVIVTPLEGLLDL